MNLLPVIRQRYFDANGLPLAGGKLWTYQTGTTTPQATYTDSGGLTPNANPVILDANGEANVWADQTLSYKFVLKNSSDVVQWTVDGVIGLLTANSVNSASLQDGSVTGAAGGGKLAASAISAQTEDLTPAAVDYVLTYDASAALLKKVSKANMQKLPLVSKTTTYTATAEDHVILVSAAASWSLALPSAVGITGKQYIVKRTDSVPAQTVTVDPNGTETINGVLTVALIQKDDSITVVSNGTNWELVSINKMPSIQKFLSGTAATYTTPLGARWIRVRAVGGGGGGSDAADTAGSNGVATTFGTALISAAAGDGANGKGSAGTASTGSSLGGLSGLIQEGAAGHYGMSNGAGVAHAGNGGGSVFGGGGGAGPYSTTTTVSGTAALANSGGGGGGGCLGNVANAAQGAGGGGGGSVEATITSPSATYTYTVGGGGAGGTNGGAGGSGVIIVEEFF